MRLILLLVCLAASVASGYVNVEANYHEKIGIPTASRIRAYEESIMNKRDPEDAAVNEEDPLDVRIVGGSVAPINAHPYLAGLLITFVNIAGTSACGSSLLSANRLVTAAHCWFDGRFQANQFTVVLGSNFLFFGGTRIATSTVIAHPQWTPSILLNDVAMIYLPTSVFFSEAIQPIALPNLSMLWETFDREWSTAAGYGFNSDQQTGISTSTTIHHVNLQVITVGECQAVFGTWAQPSNICTNGFGGVGICSGDSGGPLFIIRNGQKILVGVSSFVASIGCQLGYPSAFARVTSFYSWMIQHL